MGSLPFLGASENNGGITGMTDLEIVKRWTKTGEDTDDTLAKKVFGPNWLAVTNNGSVGNVYFVEHQYTSSHDVTSLRLKDKEMSPLLALFLIQMVKKAGTPFSYAKKWRPIRMRFTKMMLPIKQDKTPDWDYMEQYIANIIVETSVPEIESVGTSKVDLNSVIWKEFAIEEIAEVLNGVRLTSDKKINGKIPFIGARDNNNGVDSFVGNINKSTDENFLGVNYDGNGVALSWYHPYKATVLDSVKRLHIKDKEGQNAECYLFLSMMIKQQKSKYQYGYKFNGQRMKAQKILLPVDEAGKPNWEFIRDYLRSIPNARLI